MKDKLDSLKSKALELGASEFEVAYVTGKAAKPDATSIADMAAKQWQTEDEINAAGTGLTQDELAYEPLADDYVPLSDMVEYDPIKINARKSAKSAAATSALLTGSIEEAIQHFQSVLAKDLDGAGSEALAQAKAPAELVSMEARKEVAQNVLKSDKDDDTKVNALNNLASEDSVLSDPNYLLAKRALETPVAYESDEVADQRVSLIDALDWANEQRYKEHQMYNAAVSKLDPDYNNALWDMATTGILPFVEPFITDNVYQELKKSVEEKDRPAFDSWLAGNQKADIRDWLAKASPEARLNMAEKLVSAIESHATSPLTGMNDPAKLQMLEEFIGGGGYDSSDQAIDNLFELLDYTILGGLAGRGIRSAGRVVKSSLEAATQVDNYRNYVRYSARGDTDPLSAGRVAGANNPELARELHNIAVADETDEMSEVLFGASRDDVIVDNIAAQPESVDGSVKYRVGHVDLDVSGSVLDASRSGELERTQLEKDAMAMAYHIMHTTVPNMVLRREMTQVGESVAQFSQEADGLRVRATYGPKEGGWTSAEEAMDTARYNLRELGVPDENIRLLQRRGDKYVEVKVEDAKAWELLKDSMDNAGVRNKEVDSFTKDYIIQIDNHYKYKDSDSLFSEYEVKNNIFDRLGAWAGSMGEVAAPITSRIQTMALDPASVVDPRYFKAASVAVARAANIEKEILAVGQKFGDGFLKLPRKRQVVLEEIIKEANYKGKHYSEVEAAAQGISRQEKEILDSWKSMWDSMYVLENMDAVRSLRNQGYKEFVSKTSDTKLFTKPVGRNNIKSPVVYDPDTGNVITLKLDELDSIYENGGTLASVRGGVKGLDGSEAQYVVVKNNPESFMRELNDHTEAIKYREGYYAVKYKTPWFVDKEFYRADGTSYKKAVASFGTKKEADAYFEKMSKREGKVMRDVKKGVEYLDSPYFQPRTDKKGGELDVDSWDLAVHAGRSAQRVRGERLAGSEELVEDSSKAAIFGPVESMVSSARSIANRTSVRRVIETGKARFVEQYGKYMPVDPVTGQPQWPSSIGQIKQRGSKRSSINEVGDARTMFAYIDYMENGYVNSMDNLYKMIVNGLANWAGGKSVRAGKVFDYLRETRGPTGFGKSVAFNAYLALNPLRQAIVQSHQAIQLTANFPREVVVDIPRYVSFFTAMEAGADVKSLTKPLKAAGIDPAEFEHMYKSFKQSGLIAQIDKQNLVREGLTHIVDQTTGKLSVTSKAGRAASTALGFSRKVGFDVGETANMMTSFIAHWQKAKRNGKDLKKLDAIDEVVAESINYTYNMNAAGDMRYNSNSLGLFMQFMQVPHKALLQMTTNRHLSKAEKTRLAVWNTVMYGLPTGVAIKLGSDTFEDKDTAHAFTFGLESLLLNKLLNDSELTETDFASSLSPTGTYGFSEAVSTLLTERSLSEAIASTPSGKLFVGSDPRIADAFRSVARLVGWSEDFDKNPTTAAHAAKEFVEVASGMSNIFKGLYMDEVGRTISGLDLSVTEEDAWRTALFGFSTADESRARALREDYFNGSKQLKEDVKEYYRLMKAHMLKDSIDPASAEYISQMYNNVWRVWRESSVASEFVMKELQTLMSRDVERYDVKLVDMIFKMHGIKTKEEMVNWANSLPESDAYDKNQIIETINIFSGE